MEGSKGSYLQHQLEQEDGPDDLTDDQIERLLKNAELRLEHHTAQSSEAAIFSESVTSRPPYKFPQLKPGSTAQPYVVSSHGVARADTTRFLNSNDRELTKQSRVVEDSAKVKSKITKEKKATAGPDWFNLPRTNLTLELKRDLQLLKMRSVLDPKRHYKKENMKAKTPEFSQVGTLVEGPTEFFSSRLLNRDRKQTFVDEVLAAEDSNGRFKSKYNDIQASRTSGKKAFYKTIKAKRSNKKTKR